MLAVTIFDVARDTYRASAFGEPWHLGGPAWVALAVGLLVVAGLVIASRLTAAPSSSCPRGVCPQQPAGPFRDRR